MQRLASEGRTVFVSSHLMNEMQETAEHVLVIGRGRLIADTSVADLMRNSARSHVRTVSPQAAANR
jgi:ABC-2 type transport system ATP-binding protein